METLVFENTKKFRNWLEKNHTRCEGIWLKHFKKTSGVKSISPIEALEQALCFGWITGKPKKYDEKSWGIKYMPRRKGSLWSKINVGIAKRLIKEGNMSLPGLKEIQEAKKDGRWKRAYDPQSKSKIPDDFLTDLKKDKKAEKFFNTLNKTNLYSIFWRLQTAKTQETREKWKKRIIEMLSKGERFH